MTLPPLRRQVMVACDPATAYRLFLEEIGTWWPVGSHGCFGAGASVALDGDRIVETSPTGETAIWGTITTAEPPATVAFTWHPGLGPDDATHVTVAFTPTGDPGTTLVTLEHSGWESYADAASARERYAGGWVTVLDRYVDAQPVADATDGQWLVLEHTAGAAAPPEGVFASPDFPKHLEFLRSLRADGVLVAGGPLPDSPGTGMTIVRVTGFDQARRVVAAAQSDDDSVTSGLLDVRVRPWRVEMSG